MHKIKAVIFDCDGTLVDSEFLSNQILAEYVAEFGLQITTEETTELFSGGKMADSIHVLETRLGRPLPDTFVPEFRRRQAVALRERLQPIPGAHALLSGLDKPFCLASNAPLEKCNLNLEVTGLMPFFSPQRIFSAYQIDVWKPEPDLFLYAAEQMGFEPHECAVIEDSPVGVAAGVAAGMLTFAFDPTDRNAWNATSVNVVRSLSEVAAALA